MQKLGELLLGQLFVKSNTKEAEAISSKPFTEEAKKT